MRDLTGKRGIVSFDLDHTLLDNDKNEICASALLAIEKMRPHYYIVIASGRDMDNYYSREFKDIVKPDAIIHQNGTKITIGDELFMLHLMEPELVKRIMDYAEKNGLSVGTTVDGKDYFTHPELKAEADRSYNKFIKRNFVAADELYKLPVRALYYSGRNDEDDAAFLREFPMMRLLTFSSGRGADLVEKGYSKADGLKRLCGHYGIDIKDTYAFGDSMNDLEIIKAAGTGIAVGNAVQELKEAADMVCDDIKNDGIYKACRDLGLI